MAKRLKDYNIQDRKPRSAIECQVLPIEFNDDQATKRIVMHHAKRIILQHKDELLKLANK